MTSIDEARSALVGARNILVTRRGVTTNQSEKQAIDDAIAGINLKIKFLNQAGLLQAAQAVSDAAGTLQKVIDSAHLDPLDTFVSDVKLAIKHLSDLQGQMQGAGSPPEAAPPSSLPPAPAVSAAAATVSATAAMVSATTASAPPGLFKPMNSSDFGQLRQEYQAFYDASTLRPEFKGEATSCVSHLTKSKDRYDVVGKALGIPWQFVGIIHGLEGSFNFGTHLHNGDPLTARTVQVPAGRPKLGNPPFAWEDSARDALKFHHFDKETDWSVPHMLFLWETYNGFGYRPRGIPSPYLWSFSNIYEKGKFVKDGVFDSTVASAQCGAAVMLKAVGAPGA